MSLFKKPSELGTIPTIKMLVYGQPGIGKSTLALSSPCPVLLDFDGGVSRVNGAFRSDYLEVRDDKDENGNVTRLAWDKVIEALNLDYAHTQSDVELAPFKTIVIDTVGKMLDCMGAYIMRNDSKMRTAQGQLTLKGYGVRKQMFVDFIKKCSDTGKNIVFVAHEKEDKDGDVRIVRPEIGGSSASDLMKELDLVCYMQAVGTERTVFWTPQEKFYAKNTCNLPAAHKVTSVLDANGSVISQNTFLTTIFNEHVNYLKRQAELSKLYENLLEVIAENVANVVDVDSANDAKERIENFEHVWDSKKRAAVLLNKKCVSLGLKFNKLTGKYEQAA